jgi:uncharacterized OsmC-like protein
MKTKSKWVNGKQSVITNERGHSAVTDLPEAKKGTNSSYTAIEMTLMSLAACITTIYSVISENKKSSLYDMEVEVEAEQDKETINSVNMTVEILTDSTREQATKIFEQTLQACPVGILFKRAGVDLDYSLQIHNP